MSSHHIVRDDQEPAVLIESLDASTTPLIFSLLEWSPIVIANQKSLETLLSLDIKIDVVFIENSPLEVEELMKHQQDYYEIVHFKGNLLRAVLEWLSLKKHFALNFCTLHLEEESKKEWLHQTEISTIVTFERLNKIFLSKKGVFDKWLPSGSQLKLSDESVTYENLKKIHQGEYEVIDSRQVVIQHQEPLFVTEILNINFDL